MGLQDNISPETYAKVMKVRVSVVRTKMYSVVVAYQQKSLLYIMERVTLSSLFFV